MLTAALSPNNKVPETITDIQSGIKPCHNRKCSASNLLDSCLRTIICQHSHLAGKTPGALPCMLQKIWPCSIRCMDDASTFDNQPLTVPLATVQGSSLSLVQARDDTDKSPSSIPATRAPEWPHIRPFFPNLTLNKPK